MTLKTDFTVIEGIIVPGKARTSDIFAMVNATRDVISNGAMVLDDENDQVRKILFRLVHQNWDKFEPAANRQRQGDLGGFYGHFEQDMAGIVRQTMKPLDAAYKNLCAAQYNLSRFAPAFTKWMAPIGRTGKRPDTVIIDGGW